MKKNIFAIVLAFSLLPNTSFGKELSLGEEANISTSVSIYNDNLAFIKDVRKADLNMGNNSVAFIGVARDMRPETAMINAEGVSVLEQNYEYSLISSYNILNEYIGKEVITAMTNQTTGRDVYDKAILLNNSNGAILKFSHGIDSNFPGRIIVSELPLKLREKPTLVASLETKTSSSKNIELSYLTRGMSWKADYIANVKEGDHLDLTSFITINNNSGVDYNDAVLHLISGSVNQVSDNVASSYDMPMNRMSASAKVEQSAIMAGGISKATLGEYHIYDVPEKTTIKDNQTKQVRLFNSNDVAFKTKYLITSPLSLYYHSSRQDFEKANPVISYNIKNNQDSSLGLPLPSGVVRFYSKDSNSNSQFIGESKILQTAIGEEVELNLGVASDIFAKGKVSDILQIAEKTKEVTIKVTINNAKTEDVKVVFEQYLHGNWSLLSENLKSEKKSSTTLSWELAVEKQGKIDLEFKVRVKE